MRRSLRYYNFIGIMAKINILFVFLLHTYGMLSAQEKQDTLIISRTEAEKIFLDNNLSLIAANFDISQADALLLQAKAWPNPNISIDEINFNRNETSERIPPLIGDFGKNQQFTMQFEQLFLTAKKRKKNIALEISNKEMASHAYTDMLQVLKVEFRSAVAELLYQQSLQEDLSFQNRVIDKLLAAQTSQLKQGNISRSDFMRIKALKIAINADLNDVKAKIGEKESTIKTLMALDPNVQLYIKDDVATDINRIEKLSIQRLLEAADRDNLQIKMAGTAKEIGTHQLAIEKAKQVPDIAFNINYDRAGSTMFNFFGAGLSMDIPLFDRNKGNIKYATHEIQKREALLQQKKLEISNQVREQYQNLQHLVRLYQEMDDDYINELQKLQTAATENFLKRDLSLLEFLDLFSSFKESKQFYYQSRKDIQIKLYELNYLTGEVS